ncbi:MAG TPA: S8 family serine peptidase [Candidatus Binatia bacterium]|nr:S8 family serine peptidase [Candidatus Binatia bacterium]
MLTIFFALLMRFGGIAAVADRVASPALPAAHHKVQVQDPALAGRIIAQGGRLIGDYGGYQLYEVPQISPDLAVRPEVEVRDGYHFIHLNTGRLDTRTPKAQALQQSVGSFPGKRLHLVQFSGPVQAAWREELLKTGIQMVTYIPENCYLVCGDAPSLVRLHGMAAANAYIQWEAPYLDKYKIHPAAQLMDAKGIPRRIGTEMFAVQLAADAEANPATLDLLKQYQLEPIKKQHRVLNYLDVVVRLAPENLDVIAARPDVVSIQPCFPPRKLDERQDQIVAGNLSGAVPTGPGYLTWLESKGFNQAQFTNSGFVVDVTDSGIDNGTTTPNHPALHLQGDTANTSRVAYARLEGTPNNPGSTLTGCDGHGTLNSHLIGGYDDLSGFPHTDNAGYHYGLGVCPFVRLGSSVVFDPDAWTSPDYTDLQSRAYQSGARISNNSWGTSVGAIYDADAQEYDSLVRDAQPAGAPFPAAGDQEMVLLFAAGNDGGTGTIVSPGTAKNVITVGASENVQPIGGSDWCGFSDADADNANDLVSSSGGGPCADGRHKPDLVAPGTHIIGGLPQAPNPGPDGTVDSCFTGNGLCGGPASYFYPNGQQFFGLSSGTSHSSPCVAGGCALLRQYFMNSFAGPPSPAMTKAYLMNSARYLTGANANDTLWSDHQGMGEMNLGAAFDGLPRVLRDELPQDLFTASGQTRTFTNNVADPTKPVRITLAWTDAPGSTSGDAYNNDLDLTVSVGTTIYKGNVFSGPYSVAGGTADAQNNVESVFLPAGISGTFTVQVTAANINSDGVPNNSFPLDQDFALVAYNALPIAPLPVAFLTNALGIAAGAWHSLVLGNDDAVSASGQDDYGQCNVPGGLGAVLTVAAGGYHSLALTFNGTVIGWGANNYGQTDAPAGLSNVIAVAAGTRHSLALRADGTVVAWGDNNSGQCSVPPGLTNCVAIAGGGRHSLILRANGTVAAWGDNSFGQCNVPVSLTNAVAIGAGEKHSLAVKADGTVVGWGDNSAGQSQPPGDLANAVAVAGGGNHSVALKADTTVIGWGSDQNGQIGFPSGLSNVVAIAAGNSHTVILQGNRFAAPQILRPVRNANQFSVAVRTFAGKNYTLEYKTSFSATGWSPAAAVRGNGALQFLLDSAATGPQRFYRVRQW